MMAFCSSSFQQLCDPVHFSNYGATGMVDFSGYGNKIVIPCFGIKRSGMDFGNKNAVSMSLAGCFGGGLCSGRRSYSVSCSALSKQVGGEFIEQNVAVLNNEVDVSLVSKTDISLSSSSAELESSDGGGDTLIGNGGDSRFPPGGGGGSGDSNSGSHQDGDDQEEKEFGPLLKFEEVMKEAQARGVSLPSDMLEAAKSIGIRKVLLLRYLDLQASAGPLGIAIRSCSMLRNRMLADPSFLFKIGTEIFIDTCCATYAEVQKRGKDFWSEFELYVADMLVGVVVNVALVGMLAPYVRLGQPPVSNGFLGRMHRAYSALPSSVFEAERPGCGFSIEQRVGTYFYKGIMYASVGFACGIIGQGTANLIMTIKRRLKKSDDDVPVPPLLKSAALWGVFLGVSSNSRYQIVTGLERVVEASSLAKQFPPVAMAFTVGVRCANNIYAGMQFVDWARWSGVQ